MENDLIRRKDAENVVMNHCGCCGRAILQIPEVDAVEVVRCKDCREYLKSEYDFYYCDAFSDPDENEWIATKPDFFCANGKRADTKSG